MRVFFTACIAAAVIAIIGALVLQTVQVPVESAYATSSVRI